MERKFATHLERNKTKQKQLDYIKEL